MNHDFSDCNRLMVPTLRFLAFSCICACSFLPLFLFDFYFQVFFQSSRDPRFFFFENKNKLEDNIQL